MAGRKVPASLIYHRRTGCPEQVQVFEEAEPQNLVWQWVWDVWPS